MKRQNSIIVLITVLAATALAALFTLPPFMHAVGIERDFRPYRFGLDIAGGSELIYEVDMSQVDEVDRDPVMSGLRDVIEKRVNLFGVSEPRVVAARSGDAHRLIVELAGIRDVGSAIQEIGMTPFLDFREVSEVASGTQLDASGTEAVVDTKIVYAPTQLTGRYIKSARLGFEQQGVNEPIVLLQFNDEGSKIFEELTRKNLGKPLAVFLDDPSYTNDPAHLITAPVVQAVISGGEAQITGRFTVDEARQLVERFNAGALPAPIQLVSQQTVDAVLGQQALSLGVIAGILGTLAVMIFMIVYYGRLGLYACAALIIYIFLTLAIFKLVPVTLTLAGIAGFILSIGMAVDANILIFERTREEIARGMGRAAAIEEGFRRAWLSIRDSNVSTIITSLVLYFFTTSIVQGFALTLLLGVLISMFSAITVTRTLLRVFMRPEKTSLFHLRKA